MGQLRSGQRIDNNDRSFALTADAALSNRIAVIFGSTRNHVDVPDYRGQICAGLVDVIGTTTTAATYASGDTDVCIIRKGILAYPSGDTHAIGTKLSIYNTDGDLGTWLPGHHCVGIALDTVSTAGDWGLAYFNVDGSLGSHGGHYIIAGGAFAADGSFTTGAPAGFYKYSFIVEETNNQAVTGGLDIGTTSSGEELVSQQAISGLDLVEIAYDNTLTTVAAAIDLTANDSIYVSAHTNWTSAPSVTIWMILELLYE